MTGASGVGARSTTRLIIGGGVGARTTSRGHRFSRVIIRPRYSYSSALSLSVENDPGEYDLSLEVKK
jgi:hypothetical protein